MAKCVELRVCRDSEYTRIPIISSLQKVLFKFFDRDFWFWISHRLWTWIRIFNVPGIFMCYKSLNVQHFFLPESISIITITMIIAFHLHQHATGANALPTPPTLPTRAHNPDRHATQVTHGSTKSMPFFKLEQKWS